MGSILEYLPRREPTLKRDVLPNYLPTRAGARRLTVHGPRRPRRPWPGTSRMPASGPGTPAAGRSAVGWVRVHPALACPGEAYRSSKAYPNIYPSTLPCVSG
jgi:hypothetical protein